MTNKELVLDFYRDVFNAHDTAPVPRYIREDYIQHNPTVEQGRAGFLKFCEQFFKANARHDILLCVAENDLVAVLVDVSFSDGSKAKVSDIYRIEDGKIAEHWDAVQRM